MIKELDLNRSLIVATQTGRDKVMEKDKRRDEKQLLWLLSFGERERG